MSKSSLLLASAVFHAAGQLSGMLLSDKAAPKSRHFVCQPRPMADNPLEHVSVALELDRSGNGRRPDDLEKMTELNEMRRCQPVLVALAEPLVAVIKIRKLVGRHSRMIALLEQRLGDAVEFAEQAQMNEERAICIRIVPQQSRFLHDIPSHQAVGFVTRMASCELDKSFEDVRGRPVDATVCPPRNGPLVDDHAVGAAKHDAGVPFEEIDAFLYQVRREHIVVCRPTEIFAVGMTKAQIVVVRPADVRLIAKVFHARIGSRVLQTYLTGRVR